MMTTIIMVTMIALLGLTTVISVAALVVLIINLTAKELVGAGNYASFPRLGKFSGVGILPSSMASTVIVKGYRHTPIGRIWL
ncbi:MAG: hypothetical protein HW402_931 [Dehalococcoidales bacterium]|nr:hypothetical protein [Dehalococcoidales bacterium]